MTGRLGGLELATLAGALGVRTGGGAIPQHRRRRKSARPGVALRYPPRKRWYWRCAARLDLARDEQPHQPFDGIGGARVRAGSFTRGCWSAPKRPTSRERRFPTESTRIGVGGQPRWPSEHRAAQDALKAGGPGGVGDERGFGSVPRAAIPTIKSGAGIAPELAYDCRWNSADGPPAGVRRSIRRYIVAKKPPVPRRRAAGSFGGMGTTWTRLDFSKFTPEEHHVDLT